MAHASTRSDLEGSAPRRNFNGRTTDVPVGESTNALVIEHPIGAEKLCSKSTALAYKITFISSFAVV